MGLLPIFLKLDGRRALVVGAGSVALDKIASLLQTGAQLRVVAPAANPEIRQLTLEGKLEWIERPFASTDLDGNAIVIAATNAPEVNAQVYREAVARGIPANSVDDPPNCDFFFASVVNRGALQVAISTAGESPALAQQLRREIDEQLPRDLAPWLQQLGQLRCEVLATHPPGDARRLLLHQLARRALCDFALCPSRLLARAPLDQQSAKVYLVGAGPGDPDLLTVKALRILQAADVVLHDGLVPRAILDLAPPTAELIDVGKRCGAKNIAQEEINALLIDYARAQRTVVRLKSGDPLLFSRAAEEIAALNRAGVAFEIVPGITAAFAAAAAIRSPLTSRSSASSVIFSTAHRAAAQPDDQASLAQPPRDATRVVYMPGRDLRPLAQQWLDEGLPADLPCAVVSHAAQPGQQFRFSTLASLGGTAPDPAPSLLIAGWVVSEGRDWTQTVLASLLVHSAPLR
jgi:uroporphyrin-III C-methyltransferase/precorrin-2 dehydrogenase/sirohydrochlorin ferrochelatase